MNFKIIVFLAFFIGNAWADPDANEPPSPPVVVRTACDHANEIFNRPADSHLLKNPLLGPSSFWQVEGKDSRILAQCADNLKTPTFSVCLVTAEHKSGDEGTFVALVRSPSDDINNTPYAWAEEGPFYGGTPDTTVEVTPSFIQANQAFWTEGGSGMCSGKKEILDYDFKTGELHYQEYHAGHTDLAKGVSPWSVQMDKILWKPSAPETLHCVPYKPE